MAVRKANAVWHGKLVKGKGYVCVESGIFDAPYSFAKRFEEEKGTNPEELIGAAHAACFSMALSAILEEAGFESEEVATEAHVSIEKVSGGFKITKIKLLTKGKVSNITEEEFIKLADKAKSGCPVSQALSSLPVELEACLA